MSAANDPPRDPDTVRALDRLDRLAEAAVTMAEGLAAASKAPGADLVGESNAFCRVARAARLTIMLHARIAREGLAGAAAADALRRTATSPALRDVDAEPQPRREPDQRERLERERPEPFDELTVDEALTAIQHGLGLAAPIDLTAENDDEIPATATILARAGGRPLPARARLSATFDAQVRALLPTAQSP